MNFFILDERKVWHRAALNAARKAGFEGKRIYRGEEATEGGVGFIRPHADPDILMQNQLDYSVMLSQLNMIQDPLQVAYYEDKSAQFQEWGDWMPPTWRFETLDETIEFLQGAPYPIVSKADVGASSVNVRIINDRDAAEAHVRQLFGEGVVVEHSSEVPKSIQKDYALLQEFIPHDVTWRVNAIGDARAIFRRFCYKNRPVAQTGNVEPVMKMTEEIESLLEYSNAFFKHAKTKWCAVDILKEKSGWKLLETSLAWPWPSPGKCNAGPIFGTKRRWIEMFEVMFDQYKAGAWQASS